MNPVEVEIFRHLFESVAEEMGIVLRHTAFSPNIVERLDFSCAVVDAGGAMIAQAAHIPVHLGSCHLTARHLLAAVDLDPGDVVVVNDPFLGGTHLPDITLFAPVFLDGSSRPDFGVICRAHHADVGGGVPGSMGDFEELYQEGLVIPPVKIVAAGVPRRDIEALILANVRTPDERRGDLAAQLASCERGARRIVELAARYGAGTLEAAGVALRERAARAMRAAISDLPDGRYRAKARLDGPDSPLIAAEVRVEGERIRVDFTGTDPAVPSAVNAHEAITLSCVFYLLRTLIDDEVPTNSGVLEPLELVLPAGSLVGAERPSAVAGGNVETSQRIVDVLQLALARARGATLAAPSQGTMNNLSVGGRDGGGRPFTYFETIAGGMGGGPLGPGASGLHSHMTNTLNTPVEALESAYPLRVRRYAIRRGSGGEGKHPGGEGLVREIEALVPVTISLLATRRAEGAPGARGGAPGAPGRDWLIGADGRRRRLAPRVIRDLAPGEAVRIETPGGGGWGASRG
ncbi:MAG: hydantoinase B/oxoprolinase family protein [Planctomycetota bacterium]